VLCTTHYANRHMQSVEPACPGQDASWCHATFLNDVAWSAAGTAFYMLEQGQEYLADDLANTASNQASAAECASKCRHHTGCTAWTWHHPTAASGARSCHLKADRPNSTLKVQRNPHAVSGSLLGKARCGLLRHACLHHLLTARSQGVFLHRPLACRHAMGCRACCVEAHALHTAEVCCAAPLHV
jgi:hypothetical protein